MCGITPLCAVTTLSSVIFSPDSNYHLSSPPVSSASSSSIISPTHLLTAASLASSFSFAVYVVCSFILHSWSILLTAISQLCLCAALPGRFLASLPSGPISTSSSFTALSCRASTFLISYLIQDCSVPHKTPQKGEHIHSSRCIFKDSVYLKQLV